MSGRTAKGQSGTGGQSARSDWFYPVSGTSASVSGYAANGSEASDQAQPRYSLTVKTTEDGDLYSLTECKDGVCPVPWAKPEVKKVPESQILIAGACDEIKELLLKKNERYGDSALNPVRVFSKASAQEQLLVRIDDKLSRVQRGAGLLASDEDVIQDLIGYLILLKIAIKKESTQN